MRANPATGFETWTYHAGLPVNPYGGPAWFLVRLTGDLVSGVYGPLEGHYHIPGNMFLWLDLPFKTDREYLASWNLLREEWSPDDRVWKREQTVPTHVVQDLLRWVDRAERQASFKNGLILAGFALFCVIIWFTAR